MPGALPLLLARRGTARRTTVRTRPLDESRRYQPAGG